MRIDLGCGEAKHPGCKGIDKRGLPDVDLVHDFDSPLPLSDDSVDFAMLADSVQFTSDLPRLMEELYRVCRHGAVICISAPYAHASSHLANPSYRVLLSEQSPRYWTPHPACYVDPDEYRFCAEPSWSLHAGDAPDLRLVRLEFFYYPQYEGMYEPHELSLLRQSQMNVAHHFMMHLVVVKESVSEDEMQWLAVQPMEEPSYVQELRFPVRSGSEEPFLYPGPLEPMMAAAAPSAKNAAHAGDDSDLEPPSGSDRGSMGGEAVQGQSKPLRPEAAAGDAKPSSSVKKARQTQARQDGPAEDGERMEPADRVGTSRPGSRLGGGKRSRRPGTAKAAPKKRKRPRSSSKRT